MLHKLLTIRRRTSSGKYVINRSRNPKHTSICKNMTTLGVYQTNDIHMGRVVALDAWYILSCTMPPRYGIVIRRM